MIRIVIRTFIISLLLITFSSFAAEETEADFKDLGFETYRDNCRACHLDTGWGNRSIDCPSIAGLPRWYVSMQLREFRSGHRGAHREDEQGKLMTNVAMRLSEKNIAFLGKYIESLEANPIRKTTSEFDSKRGEEIYKERCVDCHGAMAEGDRRKRIPPLDKQPDWYLLSQMWKFNIQARIHSAAQEIPIDVAKEAGDLAAYLSSIETEEK